MANPVAVVVGSSRGIGLELVRALHGRGYEVFATCRTSNDNLTAISAGQEASRPPFHIVTDVDVGRDGGCAPLSTLPVKRVELLICNAGVLYNDTLDGIEYDQCREQFETNALGPLRAVTAIRHKLFDGSKVMIVGSLLGSIGSNLTGGRYGYRMSKAAAHAVGVSLAADLRPAGIAVGLVHPGVVITDMTKRSGSNATVKPEDSAAGILKRVDGLTMHSTGRFWNYEGLILPF